MTEEEIIQKWQTCEDTKKKYVTLSDTENTAVCWKASNLIFCITASCVETRGLLELLLCFSSLYADWAHLFFREEKLANLLHKKKYLKAIGLAITLDQPFKVLNIIKRACAFPFDNEIFWKFLLAVSFFPAELFSVFSAEVIGETGGK